MSNIIIPGKKYLEVNQEIELPTPRLKGYYTVRVLRNDKSCRAEYKFPNLILTGGLNRIGTTSACGVFHVGSSAAEPQITDTYLGSEITYQSTGNNSVSYATNPPYYGVRTFTGQFAPPKFADNTVIAEIGISNSSTSTVQFWSRELIRDINGNATTITVQSDEYLDVTYELRCYVPVNDIVQNNVTITGVGSRNVTMRAADATSIYWSANLGNTASYYNTGSTAVFTGSLGPVTGEPSGTTGSGSITTSGTYANNSYERLLVGTWGINQGNIGSIKSFWYGTSYGAFQGEFDTSFPKLNTQILTLTFKYAWARYP